MAGPLIAVWSPKGGVGKTLIATGLAMHLTRRCGHRTLLIDLDAGKADIAPLLQISTRPSVLDYPTGDGQTVLHPAGLQILPGPARLVDEGLVTAELTQAILSRALAAGHTIVADLDGDLRDSTMVALERADIVLLVTTPDLLSLYPARRFTQEAELIGLNLRHFRLVINRATSRQEIPDREILDLIGLPLAGRVPSLPGLSAAVNRGMMSATMRSNTDFAAAMHLIADELVPAGIPPMSAARPAQPAAAQPAGLLPALRRWWHSL